MPILALLVAVLQLALPPHRTHRVTVAQLEDFLTSRRAAKESDSQVAEDLMRVELSEELTSATLSRIVGETRLRPQTEEQISLLAAESVFQAPPTSEQIRDLPPDTDAQERILSHARSYAATALRHLPDFLAMRTSDIYDNAPQSTGARNAKRVLRMHFVRQHRREVTYRNGSEVSEAQNLSGHYAPGADEGFGTTGEFGQLLRMVMMDSSTGTVAWKRWQRGASGTRLAVFQYSVPKAASEYRVDLCCFQESEELAAFPFRGTPAYHGEIFVHPDSGVVERVTVEADLPDGVPVRKCSMAVDYGPVKIDGKSYMCPIRGVAVLAFYSPSIAKIDGVGEEKHIGRVAFDHYHRFGSTMRMINQPGEK